MKKETQRFYARLGLVVLLILWYTRPLAFEKIMPGFYEQPIVKCEAVYQRQEAGENGKPRYTTLVKEFEVGSEDYESLMLMLEGQKYKKQLAAFFVGGKRNSYSIPYPYAEIVFVQEGRMYEMGFYSKYLPAGPVREKKDYSPQSGRRFYEKVIEFVETHGTTVGEEVRQY